MSKPDICIFTNFYSCAYLHLNLKSTLNFHQRFIVRILLYLFAMISRLGHEHGVDCFRQVHSSLSRPKTISRNLNPFWSDENFQFLFCSAPARQYDEQTHRSEPMRRKKLNCKYKPGDAKTREDNNKVECRDLQEMWAVETGLCVNASSLAANRDRDYHQQSSTTELGGWVRRTKGREWEITIIECEIE